MLGNRTHVGDVPLRCAHRSPDTSTVRHVPQLRVRRVGIVVCEVVDGVLLLALLLKMSTTWLSVVVLTKRAVTGVAATLRVTAARMRRLLLQAVWTQPRPLCLFSLHKRPREKSCELLRKFYSTLVF